MKTLSAAAAFFLSLLALCTLAANQQVSKDESTEIRELEEQVNEAVVNGDLKFFEENFADDFMHTSHSGRFRTKAEWLKGRKPGESPYTSFQTKDLQIRLYGDTAVVTGKSVPKGADSKGRDITGEYRFLRVWAKRGSRWRAVAFQGTKVME